MLQAMYNGVSGLSAEQQWMDTIGNNIANVNTTGYKSSSVSFEDQLSQTLQGASGAGTNVGGTNAIQIGLGVKLGSIGINTSQGGLQSTSKPTDMAVSGNGYFMVGDGSTVNYSRDGSFALDNQGNLVSSSTGGFVLGWTADPTTGKVDTSKQIDGASHLQIPVGSMTITNPTTQAAFSGNLSSDAPTATNPTGTYTRSINMFDSLGEKQAVNLTFNNESITPGAATDAATNGGSGTLSDSTGYTYAYTIVYPDGSESALSAPQHITTGAGTGVNDGQIDVTVPNLPAGASINVYAAQGLNPGTSSMHRVSATSPTSTTNTVSITAMGANTNPTPAANPSNKWSWSATDSTGTPVGSGSLTFDVNGKSTSTGTVTLNTIDGSNTPQSVAMDFSKITQISGASTAAPSSQDGTAPGTLTGFNVDNTGTVTGTFSNGSTRALGQVALANFQNPGGLSRLGNNEFATSPNSGNPSIGVAGSDGLGGIAAGFTEQSNVDLSKEFSNLIVSQRGFEANTKIVSTVDTLLSDVIHLVQ